MEKTLQKRYVLSKTASSSSMEKKTLLQRKDFRVEIRETFLEIGVQALRKKRCRSDTFRRKRPLRVLWKKTLQRKEFFRVEIAKRFVEIGLFELYGKNVAEATCFIENGLFESSEAKKRRGQESSSGSKSSRNAVVTHSRSYRSFIRRFVFEPIFVAKCSRQRTRGSVGVSFGGVFELIFVAKCIKKPLCDHFTNSIMTS